MSEDETDPFEEFDDPADREGDPFERLGDAGPAEAEADAAAADSDDAAAADSDDTSVENVIDSVDEWTESTSAPPLESGEETDSDEPAFEEEFIDEDDPFATGPGTKPDRSPTDGSDDDTSFGVDDPFEGMASRDDDPFGEGESVFESVDIESVDADEVWESLDAEPTTVSSAEGSRYVEVSKHRFCEQCEFFSAPPNAHCTHEEAEIIEYLDMETVRLLNCPVVAEQRELENEE